MAWLRSHSLGKTNLAFWSIINSLAREGRESREIHEEPAIIAEGKRKAWHRMAAVGKKANERIYTVFARSSPSAGLSRILLLT